jgi:two-component system OmpR family sensor kinase
MSLRARLVIGLVSVAAVGLLVLGAATYGALSSFEVGRVDNLAAAAITPAVRALVQADVIKGADADAVRDLPGGRRGGRGVPVIPAFDPRAAGGPGAPPGRGPDPGGDRRPDPPPAGSYAQQRTADGRASDWTPLSVTPGATASAPPALPNDIARGEYRTVSADGTRYRVHAAGTPSLPAQTTIVAIPFAAVDETLDELLLIEILVIGAVLAAIGLATWWTVRLGMRPLDRIGETAGAIAAGDLSRRVEPAEPRTEVGRLGLALNAMLARLEEAFAERRASEDRLRQFLADASHELRTPLASIRGYAELFRIGAAREGPDVEKAMSRIEDESTRMGVLVEDLLALARLDEVRDLHREAVDITALASDAVDDARAVAPERKIELQTAAGNGSVVLDGDAGQLRQVLANLMRNALVHTPPGTPIEVTVDSVADAREARLEVRDHGPGLPAGDPAELFERFWRADPGRGRGRAGAGLGLSIVAAIVTAHGGRAEAADAPGGGARFTITLPLRAAGSADARTLGVRGR